MYTKKELMDDVTFQDCKELKKLIAENPDLPLMICVGENAWSGESAYNSASPGYAVIQDITLYKDQWYEMEDYKDLLQNDLASDPRYEKMPNKEYFDMVDEMIEKTEYIKAIIIYVG